MAWRAVLFIPLVAATADLQHDICNSTLYPVAMELGESGVIAVDTHGVSANHQGPCRIQLQGCEACRIRLDISSAGQEPNKCQVNKTELPKYPACITGCATLLLYEPAYIDVTLLYHFGGLGPPTYTSISSTIALMFCPGDIIPENATFYNVHFFVQEKQQIFSGSPDSWGVLESPNFPEGYAVRGEVYRYVLRNSHPLGKVKVSFTDWDMAPSSRIEFYSHINGSHPLSMYFGSSARPVLFSPGPALYMIFHPEVGINVRADNMGFKAKYEFIPGDILYEAPHTDCGMYYKYLPGGMVEFASTPSMGAYLDCVWVITKHSAFMWSHVWLRNFTAGDGHAYLLVRSGVTSDGPVVANVSSSFNELSPAITFEGHSGFYLQLLGNNTGKEYVSFTFTAFNPPKIDGVCSKTSEFKCSDSSHCIDSHLVCDGTKHCVNGADENELCKVTSTHHKPEPKPCRTTEFTCNNGKRCVPHSAVCDHWLDCPDGSDEYSCAGNPMFVTERPSNSRNHCPPEERLCSSGDQCISRLQYCDGVHHCWDNSDEIDCFLRLESKSLTKAPWSILMPVGIALCVGLFVCVMTLCIKGHLKNQNETSRGPYTSSSRRPQGHTRRQRRGVKGRSVHSTGSEIPLTLNLSSSNSHATVAHLPESPPSYEEAMRLSPEGCSVTLGRSRASKVHLPSSSRNDVEGFPSRSNGRGSPQMLSPPHYTSSHSEGASSSSSSQLTQACFVFPANAEQHGALVETERTPVVKRPSSDQDPDDDGYEGIDDQPIYENINMDEPDVTKPGKEFADPGKQEAIYMNDNELATAECNGKCPPLEFTLINGSLSQSRQCCHLPRGSTSTLQSSSTLQRCSSLSSNFSPPDTLSSLPPSSTYNSHNARLVEEYGDAGKASQSTPYMIAPPPRTTSLIASLLDKGAAPASKLTRSHTASPSSTMSWTGSGRSIRGEKVLPLDSTFCHRVQRQTSDGQSSSTSTLNASETA